MTAMKEGQAQCFSLFESHVESPGEPLGRRWYSIERRVFQAEEPVG